MKKVQNKKISQIPELRIGTGFGNNLETKEFVNQLLKDKKLIELGGIMKPGAYIYLRDKNEEHRIDLMTVEKLKQILN